ncbi:MAG: hypothetical protein ACIAQZ_15450 [Sedimentisphaeraceae bacterium JB056]
MFESPWILIITAVALFCAITLFRNIMPDKKRWWQMLIPLIVLAAAFGIDYFVQTDREQIEARIVQARDAVLNRQPQVVISMIDQDYDGQHRYDRRIITQKCQEYFGRPFAEKIRINYNEITVNGNEATSELNTTVHFDDASQAGEYFELAIIEAEIGFIKRNDEWMVKSVVIEKVNNKEPPRW